MLLIGRFYFHKVNDMKATSLRNASKPRPALRLISTKELPREDWLAVRKQGIGSSDAGAAVGLNPYKSQLELWLEKTGRDTTLPKADPHDELRKNQEDKLRSIPIRLLFNESELNFRADYTLFDRQSGRPLCVGNGETCKRVTQDGMQSLPCPSPDACPLAKGGACKPYGRLNVLIGDDDPLGSFVFRTTGFNSIRTLAARLHYFQAISGNRLAYLPLELRLRGKSTRQSHGTPIFYVDLTVRGGMDMAEALQAANEQNEQRQAVGFDQAALDDAALRGFANGAFEDSEEDSSAVIEEFFTSRDTASINTQNEAPQPSPSSLAGKLEVLANQTH